MTTFTTRKTSGLIFPALGGLMAVLLPATGQAAAVVTAAPVDQSIWDQSTLGGDWGGAKSFLTNHGIGIVLFDIEEAQADGEGGLRRGSGYDGATLLSLAANLETLVGWPDASIAASVGELRGHGVSQFDTGNLLTVSNIETQPETRLFDLYLEQQLWNQQLTIRAGQMLPADDFVTSHYAGNLINSSFSWPVLLGADLPGDDPVAVISTPGIWVKLDPGGPVSGQVGIYQGASSSSGGPLEAVASTSNGSGVLVFAEASYTIKPDADGTLPAVLKLGGWYDSAQFDDLAVNQEGAPLALAGGYPRRYSGDYGYYLGIDKMLYSVPGTPDQGLGSFFRIAAAPDDRNLISLYFDIGLNYKGLLPSRPNDNLAVGFSWARASDAAVSYDRSVRSYAGPDYPIRDHEAVGEVTYEIGLAPWWTLQPDLQYVVHPALGTTYDVPSADAQRVPNAVVLGLRTSIRF